MDCDVHSEMTRSDAADVVEWKDNEEIKMLSRTYPAMRAACLAAVFAGTSLMTGAASAQHAHDSFTSTPIRQSFGHRGPIDAVKGVDHVEMPSESAGLTMRNQPGVTLPPVDADALLAEDAVRFGDGRVTRVGIVRDLIVRAPQGKWHDTRAGRIWTADIVSTGSIGTRLHLIGMNLPRGAELYVYDPANPRNMDGPFTGRGHYDNGELWTRTIWSERVRIEYFLPAGAPQQQDGNVPFVVTELTHWYRPFDVGPDGSTRGVGSCHNDVTCFPDWQDVADALGLITYVDGGQSFVCSGQLLDTEIGDLTPYYYTANHCIPNNTVAMTGEIFWFFQTASCDGSATPNISTTDMTLLDTLPWPGPEYSLLMVHGALPGGLFWVGWTTAIPAPTTDAVGVHHPGGSWKRISFGERLSGSICGGSSTNYHRASWDVPGGGVVEPGSSGSGIYRADTQQIFGALFCGTAQDPCANPSADDDYHRFDRFYFQAAPDISDLLIEGSDDSFDDVVSGRSNDTCAEAVPISPGTYNEPLVVKSMDEDWYAITLNQGEGLTVLAEFLHSRGDIDMQLRSNCGGAIVRSSTSNSDNESITFVQSGPTQTYFLRVYMDGTDTRAEYALTIDIELANDVCGTGVAAFEGSTPITTIGAQTEGPDASPTCGFPGNSMMENDIWFQYNPTCTDTITVSICDADFQPRLSVFFVLCPSAPGEPEPLACDEGGCAGGAKLTFDANAGSTYHIRVASKDGITGSGTLVITCGAPPECPADITDDGTKNEPDGTVNVFDLILLLTGWNTNGPGAEIAEPFDSIDVFDLIALLEAWGDC